MLYQRRSSELRDGHQGFGTTGPAVQAVGKPIPHSCGLRWDESQLVELTATTRDRLWCVSKRALILMPMTESTPQAAETLSPEACRALLDRIAASTQLNRAPRLRELLYYVARRTLDDGCSELHEQEVGIEVFGRPDTYDTSIDNIVRSNATELRKRIEAYFESEGLQEPVILEIPRGSYLPVFRFRRVEPVAITEPAASVAVSVLEPAEKAPQVQRPARRNWWSIASLTALLLAVTGCIVLWMQVRTLQRSLYPWKSSPALTTLWSGFLDGNQNTDIVLADASFLLIQNMSKQSFSFNDYLNRSYISQLQTQSFSPDVHSFLNLIAAKNLSTIGEFRVVQRILQLDPMGKNLHLYHAREYTPSLLTQDNVILIGGPVNNPWNELFKSKLNFTLDSFSNRLSPVTNHAPMKGEQQTYMPSDSVGYCVVAYLPAPGHNGKALLIQGTSSEATEAGGDFLLSNDQLTNFRRMLHANSLPYFEVLLRTSQVRGTPIAMTVEAYRTYPNLL